MCLEAVTFAQLSMTSCTGRQWTGAHSLTINFTVSAFSNHALFLGAVFAAPDVSEDEKQVLPVGSTASSTGAEFRIFFTRRAISTPLI